MKRTATMLAALAVAFAATAASVRTATETFVTNKIAEAVDALPAPDFSTNNTQLVETIGAAETDPTWNTEKGNYVQTDHPGDVRIAGRFAQGYIYNTASGIGSHVEGQVAKASGNYSHAEGYDTKASGSFSHAEGCQAEAEGSFSHAEGYGTKASGNYSHAEGVNSVASNQTAFVWQGGSLLQSKYGSHGDGTFNISPVGGAEGVWIGETNFVTWIGLLSPPASWATLSGKPTNVSAFTNDAGYLTTFSESDPTVPEWAKSPNPPITEESDPTVSAWAKAASKPTYTASEVGATDAATVTAMIREQSLGGIWDESLQVWWTPRMSNGSLTYMATTNVNLNAGN